MCERPMRLEGRVGGRGDDSSLMSRMKRGKDVDFSGCGNPTSFNVDVALAGSLAMGSSPSPLPLPWDCNGTMRQIFDDDFIPWTRPLKFLRCLPARIVLAKVDESDKIQEVKRTLQLRCHSSAAKHEDIERRLVLMKWSDLALINPQASVLGKQMIECDVGGKDRDHVFKLVSDTFRGRATSTLEQRASSLALYCKWHECQYPDDFPFPLKEPRIYEYVDGMRTMGCSATRASTFLGTIAFCKDLMGLQGAVECMGSARTKGASLDLFLHKRPMKQAPALSPIMLGVLELAAFCESDAHLRAVAGFSLCCIYGRMRVSDMSRLVHLSHIGRFIEGSLMRVKTSRTKEKQCTFLPSIFPATGLLGTQWFESFVLTREVLGLSKFPTLESGSSDRSFIVLPSRATVDFEEQRKIGASEVSDCIQQLLSKVFTPDVVSAYTSHALKTTVLTYVNVAGCDYTVSELLGYHLTNHKSAINYQRVALAAPIRFLAQTLGQVQTGEFMPMAPHTEEFVSEEFRVPILQQMLNETGNTIEELCEAFLGRSVQSMLGDPDMTDLQAHWDLLCEEPVAFSGSPICVGKNAGDVESLDSECSSDDTSSDSGASSVEEGLAVASRMAGGHNLRSQARNANTMELYRHSRTKMVHFGDINDSLKTACGRVMSESFRKFLGDAEKAWPHCKKCWGNLDP